MKLKHLFLTLIAGATALVSCDLLEEFGFNEEDLGLAELTVDLTELSLPKEESTATISLVATRDWMVSGDLPDWLTLSAISGEASKKPQTITVTVLENKGNDREATIGFTIGTKKVSVSVKQAGALGEIQKGSGTKTDPYTVAGVIAYLETLGADVNSPSSVFVKGKVSSVAVDKNNVEQYFSNTGTYGNATFFISDDGSTTTQFECYRILYLGNKKFATGDTDIKIGDDVVIYGQVVNFKGNTPETVQGSAFLFSLNGVDKGGDEGGQGGGTTAEAKGAGTQADPFNVAAAIAKAQATGQTATSEAYYIKGKVKTVTEQFSANYGNGTFVLVDEGFDAEFTAYRILYFGNQKWVEGNKTVNEGDEIVVVGKIVNFRGNTPETDQGSAYLYSLNGDTGNANPPAEETKADPAGDGTEANPFNVSAAIDKAKEVGKTATEQEYYVKGKVSKITEQFGAAYGNGTFVLVDDGFTAEFTAYRILYFGGEKWVEGDATVAVGDELVAVGKIVNYNDKTPEITQGGHLYSLNGQTSMEQSAVFGVEKTEIKVSASATSAQIKVKGNVAWSVARKSDLVTCDPTSGEGAATITVTFPANESTENEVGYSIALSTDADVENKMILVNIIQGKAGQGGEKSVTVETTNALTWSTVTDDTYKEGRSITVDGVTITCYKNTSNTGFDNFLQSNHIRIFKNYVLKIDAGTTITKVVLNCAFSDKCYEFTVSDGTKGTADTSVPSVTWEGEIDPFIAEMTGGQNRVGSIEVYYK